MELKLNEDKREIIVNLNLYLKKIHEVGNNSSKSPELILFTNFGKIRCELSPPEESDTHPISVLFNGTIQLAGVDNPAALHVKNARFQPFGHVGDELFVEDMILFTDHIIGVSFG